MRVPKKASSFLTFKLRRERSAARGVMATQLVSLLESESGESWLGTRVEQIAEWRGLGCDDAIWSLWGWLRWSAASLQTPGQLLVSCRLAFVDRINQFHQSWSKCSLTQSLDRWSAKGAEVSGIGITSEASVATLLSMHRKRRNRWVISD